MKSFTSRPYLLAAAALGLAATLALGPANAAPPDARDVATRLVTKFVAAENSMNASLLDDVIAEDYIQHNPDVPPGRAGVEKVFAEEFKQLTAAHIIVHSVVEDVVVDGDRVVLRQLTTITKRGKTYTARSIDEWRIAGGMLAEHWDNDEAPRPVASASP